MPAKIFVLTGNIQTGKTTALFNRVVENKNTAGILTPLKNGVRMFYNIATGEYFDMLAGDNENDTLVIGKFIFSAAMFARAIAVVDYYITQPNYNYLVIDEIGPLELKQQKGFYGVMMKALLTANEKNIIVVCRENMLYELTALLQYNAMAFEIISKENLAAIV
jgi:nucleoside-triphosphatase THEP1